MLVGKVKSLTLKSSTCCWSWSEGLLELSEVDSLKGHAKFKQWLIRSESRHVLKSPGSSGMGDRHANHLAKTAALQYHLLFPWTSGIRIPGRVHYTKSINMYVVSVFSDWIEVWFHWVPCVMLIATTVCDGFSKGPPQIKSCEVMYSDTDHM